MRNFLTDPLRIALHACFERGMSLNKTAAETGVSRNTVILWFAAFRAGRCRRCERAPDHPEPCNPYLRATPDMREAMVRARVDENLKTPEIASRFGVSLATAYAAVAGHSYRPDFKKGWWTSDDDACLRGVYPAAAREVVVEALRPRTWAAIQRRAVDLGIERTVRSDVWRGKRVHPVISQLTIARRGGDLLLSDLAEHSGLFDETIKSYELGNSEPRFGKLVAWAAALGFELVLRPTEAPEKAATVPGAVATPLPTPEPVPIPTARVAPPSHFVRQPAKYVPVPVKTPRSPPPDAGFSLMGGRLAAKRAPERGKPVELQPGGGGSSLNF